MREILIIVFLLLAVAIVFLVIIQQGKGAGMGASFGAGASATLFGSSGAGNFLTKLTSVLAALFFAVCLALANLGNKVSTNDGSDDKWMQIDESIARPQAEINSNQIPTSTIPQDDASKPIDTETIPQ